MQIYTDDYFLFLKMVPSAWIAVASIMPYKVRICLCSRNMKFPDKGCLTCIQSACRSPVGIAITQPPRMSLRIAISDRNLG